MESNGGQASIDSGTKWHRVQILAALLSSCVILGSLLNPLFISFPIFIMGIIYLCLRIMEKTKCVLGQKRGIVEGRVRCIFKFDSRVRDEN